MKTKALLLAMLAMALGAPVGLSASAATRVALRVPELGGAEREEIVTGGVPLAKGALAIPDECRLLDADGREVPMAATALTRWPGGSVKWLLLDFPARLRPNGEARYWLELGVAPAARPSGPVVMASEGDGFIEVTTGALRFRVRKDRDTFPEDVRLGAGEPLLEPGMGGSRLEIETAPPGPPDNGNWLRDAAGGPRKAFVAKAQEARIEFANALRAVVVVRGEYRDEQGKSIGPFWARYTAWAGSATVGVERFFAFDADVDKAFLRTLSFDLRLSGAAPLKTAFGTGDGKAFLAPEGVEEAALFEVMPDRHYHLVPLGADRRVRYQVAGARGGRDQMLEEGTEAAGWAAVETERGTVSVALRDFPRLHPKEVSVRPGERLLRYYLWPERGGKVLDLRRRYKGQRVEGQYDTGEYEPAGRGFGRTHQLLVEFRPGGVDAKAAADLARRANEPLRVFCEPEHYAACDVWNRFHPVDVKRFPETEALIRLGLEWWMSLPRKFHWDGMADWGDTLFWGYEKASHNQVKDAPPTSWVVRGYDGWLNNDCNISHDIMMFFLRSGDDRIYQYWERMVQHVMDVDTIHAAEDPKHIGGGRRHDQQHWGSTYTGYGTAAVEAGEMHLLTGSLWAREMAVKYADWYMVSGGAEWETRLPCLVLAWEITGDKKYMDFIRRPEMKRDVYGLALGKAGALDNPHWRTPGVELGVDFLYRATGEEEWAGHLVKAARLFIDGNPGNGYGRSMLAKAAMLTRDEEMMAWARRLEVVCDPYGRAQRAAFFKNNTVPPDLRGMSWDALTALLRAAGLTGFNGFVYSFRHDPYVMAALVSAGLDESKKELVDFVLDRRGMGQFHLRGPDVPDLKDARYEPVSLAPVANTDPLGDPFGRYGAWKREPLKPGEIGFDFGEWGEVEPGFLPVRPATVYPYAAPRPRPGEHDAVNLIGLPFGSTWRSNNVPFDLPDPAGSSGGKTMLVVGKGETARIPVGKTARRLYALGHVCQSRSNWKKSGARYRLVYEDGTTQSIDLTNMVDYEDAFNWGFAGKALFARNWKAQGGWDGGAPILNVYPIVCEEKPLRELVIEDKGDGIGFMILAVTAEVAGARAEAPVAEVSFAARGAAGRLWTQDAARGWIVHSGKLADRDGVESDGSATFRLAAPNGACAVELEMSGTGWTSPFNIHANGRLVIRGYVSSSGCAPGVTSRAETIRFPVSVEGGVLDLTLSADRTAGSWRHPIRLRGPSWRVSRLRLFRGTDEPLPARPEMTYGWRQEGLTLAEPHSAPDQRLALTQNRMRSRDIRADFVADAPPGAYEAEILFAVRGDGSREGQVSMNVSLQGKQVLTRFDGGAVRKPVRSKFPVTVAKDGKFTMTLEPAAKGMEWGVNALILRPLREERQGG